MDRLRKLMADVSFKECPSSVEQIQLAEQKHHDTPTSSEWKRAGDEHLDYKRYKDAIFTYTNGINAGDKSIDMLISRSSAYFHNLDYKNALADAESVLIIDNTHIKGIYGKAKALFGMALYRDAKIFLGNISLDFLSQEGRKMIFGLITEADRFIAQSENGDYPWNKLYRENSTFLEMAEYRSSVIVKQTPMKGRGLFATKVIEAGELVLASKAFAYVEDRNPSDMHYNLEYYNGSFPEIYFQLMKKIREILKENPEKHEIIGTLYAGPELGYLKPTKGASGYNNIERIEYILAYNSMTSNEEIGGIRKRNAGIWIMPSFINHCCIDANCTWTIIGDFCFIRAFHNVNIGEELLITYMPPNQLMTKEILKFVCQCRLCKRDRRDNSDIMTRRESLLSTIQTALSDYRCCTTFQKKYDSKIDDKLKLLYDLRRDSPELNLRLIDILFEFASIYYLLKHFMKSSSIFEKVYNLSRNVAGCKYATIGTCFYIFVGYTIVDDKRKAKTWSQILKKYAILNYGSLDYLHINFRLPPELIKEYDLGI